ncbi:uncharacterized protein [Leuresthes tenuis]|uniref:uncharacterized protein n=1 Tax=Leuresthes tenuis TaxID=355514 RepID=UPI003B5133E2
MQTGAAGEPLKHGQVQPVHPSARQEGGDPVLTLTPPPTEEDVKQLQSLRGKNGHIKRPMNAFLVWARLHRGAVQKAFPGAESKDVSFQLGCIWSRLSEEQQRPYYEAALKLRDVHKQQFPDYEYCPRRRKRREALTFVQPAGRQQGSSGAFKVSQDQSSLLGVGMNPCPMLAPHTVGYCPNSSHSSESCSMLQAHSARCPFASSCPLEQSHYHTHQQLYHTYQQGGGFALDAFGRETLQQEHDPEQLDVVNTQHSCLRLSREA